LVNKESGTYSHHAVTGLEFDLTSHLEFDLSLVWDRTKDPQPASDGSVPEKNDVHFYFGMITFRFQKRGYETIPLQSYVSNG
jgi:long-subunit fatty acid transport protein